MFFFLIEEYYPILCLLLISLGLVCRVILGKQAFGQLLSLGVAVVFLLADEDASWLGGEDKKPSEPGDLPPLQLPPAGPAAAPEVTTPPAMPQPEECPPAPESERTERRRPPTPSAEEEPSTPPSADVNGTSSSTSRADSSSNDGNPSKRTRKE